MPIIIFWFFLKNSISSPLYNTNTTQQYDTIKINKVQFFSIELQKFVKSINIKL